MSLLIPSLIEYYHVTTTTFLANVRFVYKNNFFLKSRPFIIGSLILLLRVYTLPRATYVLFIMYLKVIVGAKAVIYIRIAE